MRGVNGEATCTELRQVRFRENNDEEWGVAMHAVPHTVES
jgi:hypothetical protein